MKITEIRKRLIALIASMDDISVVRLYAFARRLMGRCHNDEIK